MSEPTMKEIAEWLRDRASIDLMLSESTGNKLLSKAYKEQSDLWRARAAQIEAMEKPIPEIGTALRKLGHRLAEMLQDDDWNNIEPLLLDVQEELLSLKKQV